MAAGIKRPPTNNDAIVDPHRHRYTPTRKSDTAKLTRNAFACWCCEMRRQENCQITSLWQEEWKVLELLEKELTQLCNSPVTFPSNLLLFLSMRDAILLRSLETPQPSSEQELNPYRIWITFWFINIFCCTPLSILWCKRALPTKLIISYSLKPVSIYL